MIAVGSLIMAGGLSMASVSVYHSAESERDSAAVELRGMNATANPGADVARVVLPLWAR